jgi:hypothetical protein
MVNAMQRTMCELRHTSAVVQKIKETEKGPSLHFWLGQVFDTIFALNTIFALSKKCLRLSKNA